MERLRKEGATKPACLNAFSSGFTISKYLEAKAKSAIDIPSVRSHPAKMEDDAYGIIQHPGLFKQLKEWRNEEAIVMDLPHYMILPQKTIVTLSNFLPQSLTALNLVKGRGKKKSAVFGEELLEIIISYCMNEKIEPIPVILTRVKIPKKTKEETKKTSYDLFKKGNSISQIAEERGFSITTIEGHLAHYVGTGEIPVIEFVSQETKELISSHFNGSDDFKMGPVKEALGDKVSWSEIRFVINHLKFLRSK